MERDVGGVQKRPRSMHGELGPSHLAEPPVLLERGSGEAVGTRCLYVRRGAGVEQAGQLVATFPGDSGDRHLVAALRGGSESRTSSRSSELTQAMEDSVGFNM